MISVTVFLNLYRRIFGFQSSSKIHHSMSSFQNPKLCHSFLSGRRVPDHNLSRPEFLQWTVNTIGHVLQIWRPSGKICTIQSEPGVETSTDWAYELNHTTWEPNVISSGFCTAKLFPFVPKPDAAFSTVPKPVINEEPHKERWALCSAAKDKFREK